MVRTLFQLQTTYYHARMLFIYSKILKKAFGLSSSYLVAMNSKARFYERKWSHISSDWTKIKGGIPYWIFSIIQPQASSYLTVDGYRALYVCLCWDTIRCYILSYYGLIAQGYIVDPIDSFAAPLNNSSHSPVSWHCKLGTHRFANNAAEHFSNRLAAN